MSASLILLGPQRHRPTLAEAVEALGERLGPVRRVATVTAGWEDREGEDAELDAHLGGRTRNLRLFPRAEEVFAEDRDVYAAFLERRDAMRALAGVHRPRLHAALDCARRLLAERRADPTRAALLDPEIEDAIAAVARLDRHHLRRVAEVDETFRSRLGSRPRPVVERHRREVAEELAGSDLLAIAGGHVGVLLNRLRLFDVLGAYLARGARPVIAWSAGAMALTERVVLFHDSPPQGAGDAELYGPGLALAPGLVALPHARERLNLEDPVRVELLARRFAPARAVALDEGARLEWDGGDWTIAGGARVL